jgi:cytoskeletal protein RodZ
MNPNNESDQTTPTTETSPESTNAPQMSDVTPPTSDATTSEMTQDTQETPEPEQEAAAPAAVPVVSGGPQKSGGKKTVLVLILVVLLALAAVAGVYYWQNQQLKDTQALNDQLTAQLNAAKSTTANTKDQASTKSTEVTSSAISSDLIPGQVSFNQETGSTKSDSVTLGVYVVTDNLKNAWIEYGTSADKLTSKTATDSSEFGMGEAGSYRSFVFDIKKSGLKPGIDYYYRVAATNTSGTTIYSGVAAFTNVK